MFAYINLECIFEINIIRTSDISNPMTMLLFENRAEWKKIFESANLIFSDRIKLRGVSINHDTGSWHIRTSSPLWSR